jgi:hypothetical protein
MANKPRENLIVNCFQCSKKMLVTYNYPHKKYSSKNNWEYWTEDKKNQGKYICNKCVLNLYYRHKQEYLRNVTVEKKRQLMRSYINSKRFDE